MIKERIIPESNIELKIITGMITSTIFLQSLIAFFDIRSFSLSYTKVVSGWCIEYFNKYKEAPGKHIQHIFELHKEENEDDAELIELFLLNLSKKYEAEENFNYKYILDLAEKFFRKEALIRTKEELELAISGGRIEEGEGIVANFHRATKMSSSGIYITKEEDIRTLFKEENEDELFSLSGELGKRIGVFKREDLVGIVAASKVGKSWMLQEIALKALFSNYNVAYISLENPERMTLKRIYQNLTGLPLKAGEILLPVFDCLHNQTNECAKRRRKCKVGLSDKKLQRCSFEEAPEEYTPCTVCRGREGYIMEIWYKRVEKEALTCSKALSKAQKITRTLLRGKKFKLIKFPSGSLTVQDLKTVLKNWEYYDNFIPDVILTDYADKFAADNKRDDRRIQIGQIWEAHKAMAQERHCLMVTASQSNTARSGKKIKQGDWADSIHKLNVVDTGIALNQDPEEKIRGLMRIGVLAQRNEEFDSLEEIYVLQCLKIGKFYLDSYVGR